MPSRPLVLAHRGANRLARENTVDAFVRARELGADGVELDVRRTADGVLVVHHDAAVEPVGLLVDQRSRNPPPARGYRQPSARRVPGWR
jgi:glycerophosphoryl diester phosphodiesterase